MIRKPHFYNFRLSELIQFLYDVISIFKKHNPELLEINGEVTDLEAKTQSLDKVYKFEKGSKITEEIIRLDQVRDKYLVGIHSCLDGFTRHFDAAFCAAASLLLRNLNLYGANPAKLNYQAETSTINSIVESWTKTNDLSLALGTLNFTNWVAELKNVNDQFNSRFIARVQETGLKPEESSIELRRTAISGYRVLEENTDARSVLSKDDTYKGLINDLNALIDNYNRLVSSRSGSSEKELPDETSAKA